MLKEGSEIRDYTLKRFLGRGGFGEVWLAEKKIEIADKTVPFALKFLAGDTGQISEFSSVRREINTWIDASGHKNVVSVLDGFIHENFFVIVSEFASGGSLRHWLRTHNGKSPSLEKTVEIMSGILDGLSHLHAQKIIHRDLKPENILLKGDVPCIADFGVSRMVETVSLTNSQLGTNSAGSPLYMSPESFERTKPSPQIDIWSAGVILFEMLSGKTPYSGETIPALIFEIVTKEPRPLPNDVPDEICRVVEKALEKNVAERFQSVGEMREALMKALYLQDFTPTLRDEMPEGNKKAANAFAGNAPAKTVSDIETVKHIPSARKKSFGWIYALGGFQVLAAVIAVAAWTFTGDRQEKADANADSGATNSKTEANAAIPPVNSNPVKANSETLKPETAPPAGQTGEAEKPKTSATKTPAGKQAEQPKKEVTKPTPKKKVTLDDIIN